MGERKEKGDPKTAVNLVNEKMLMPLTTNKTQKHKITTTKKNKQAKQMNLDSKLSLSGSK